MKHLALWVVRHNNSLNTAAWIVAFLCVLAYAQHKDASEASMREDNVELIKALGKVLDKCTQRGDNFIVIDGEYHVCGASPTGIKARES